MFTEQLNKVELLGTVGSISVNNVGGTKMARLSLATNYGYRDREGNAVIETTWHAVAAWEGKGITNLEDIVRGDRLHILGRLKQYRYTDMSGNERSAMEVLASRVEKVPAGGTGQTKEA